MVTLWENQIQKAKTFEHAELSNTVSTRTGSRLAVGWHDILNTVMCMVACCFSIALL